MYVGVARSLHESRDCCLVQQAAAVSEPLSPRHGFIDMRRQSTLYAKLSQSPLVSPQTEAVHVDLWSLNNLLASMWWLTYGSSQLK